MTARLLYLVRHGEAVDESALSAAGRRQASLLGERLAGTRLTSITHSPLPRATETAALIGRHLPGVPVTAEEIVGDHVPFVPEALPPVWAGFFDSYSADELAQGAQFAARVVERYAHPGAHVDTRELIVTHNYLIAWLVRHALDAPPARWLGINASNAALTVIRYSTERPPSVLLFNDMSHLPPELRWTGVPPALQP